MADKDISAVVTADFNSDIQDAVSKKHSHANKTLLDSYDQSNTDIQDAVTHKDRDDNPHSVTASQVGAITKVEDDTAPKLGGNLDSNGKMVAGQYNFVESAVSIDVGATHEKTFQISSNWDTLTLEIRITGYWGSNAKENISIKKIKGFGLVNDALGTLYSTDIYDIGYDVGKLAVDVQAVGSNNQFKIVLTNNGSATAHINIVYNFMDYRHILSEV